MPFFYLVSTLAEKILGLYDALPDASSQERLFEAWVEVLNYVIERNQRAPQRTSILRPPQSEPPMSLN